MAFTLYGYVKLRGLLIGPGQFTPDNDGSSGRPLLEYSNEKSASCRRANGVQP